MQLLAARRLAFLLDVHGKLNELVCKLCFLENFLGDVCAGLDNDNTVVGYNVTCCFFPEKETAVTFFGSLVGSSFFCRSCRFCRFLLRSFFLFRLRFFFLLRLFFLGLSCRLFLFLFRSRSRCRCRCRSCRSRCRSCLCRLCYRLSFFFLFVRRVDDRYLLTKDGNLIGADFRCGAVGSSDLALFNLAAFSMKISVTLPWIVPDFVIAFVPITRMLASSIGS